MFLASGDTSRGFEAAWRGGIVGADPQFKEIAPPPLKEVIETLMSEAPVSGEQGAAITRASLEPMLAQNEAVRKEIETLLDYFALP